MRRITEGITGQQAADIIYDNDYDLLVGINAASGSNNFVINPHEAHTTTNFYIDKWALSAATPKGRTLRLSLTITGNGVNTSLLQFFGANGAPISGVNIGTINGTIDYETIVTVPDNAVAIGGWMNGTVTLQDLYLRDSVDYSSTREQLVHDEFWIDPSGERKQVFMRTFTGITSSSSVRMTLIASGINAAKVDAGFIWAGGAFPPNSTVVYDGSGEPFTWEVMTNAGGAVILALQSTNLSGAGYSITLKYTKL